MPLGGRRPGNGGCSGGFSRVRSTGGVREKRGSRHGAGCERGFLVYRRGKASAGGGVVGVPLGGRRPGSGAAGWGGLAALRVLPLLSDGWWVAEVRR